MKNILLAVLSLTILTTSCSNVESDFQKAKAIGTVAAYQHFINRHPADPLTCEARFRKAMCDGSLPALVDYLGCDPSKHRVEWMLEAIDSAMSYLDTMPSIAVFNTWATTSNGQLKSHIEHMMFQRDESQAWTMVDKIASSRNNDYKRYAFQSYLALYSGANDAHTIKATEMVEALQESPAANEIEQPSAEEVAYEYIPMTYIAYVPVKILGIPIPIVRKETRYSSTAIPIRVKTIPSSATPSNIGLTATSPMPTLPNHLVEVSNIMNIIIDSMERASKSKTDGLFDPIDPTKFISEPISFDPDTYEDLLQPGCEDSPFRDSQNNNNNEE